MTWETRWGSRPGFLGMAGPRFVEGARRASVSLICERSALRHTPLALQAWHADGPPLFSSEAARNGSMPAHALNIFIPLVDLDETSGSTQFALGTHTETEHLEQSRREVALSTTQQTVETCAHVKYWLVPTPAACRLCARRQFCRR